MSTTDPISPLLRMTRETPTGYWNDSCAVDELAYAVARGATGATSNPSIVLDVMKSERAHWVPRVRDLAAENPRQQKLPLRGLPAPEPARDVGAPAAETRTVR